MAIMRAWVCQVCSPLQQGRRIAIEGSSVTTNLIMVCFMLPGATTEQLVSNLYAWFDTVMKGLGYSSLLAKAANGQQVLGVFHHMSKEEFANFRGHLGTLTQQWHIDYVTRNLSAGFMVEITGGTCGKGALLESSISLGLFICY